MKRSLGGWVALALLVAPVSALAESRPTLITDYRRPDTDSLELELGWYKGDANGGTLNVLTPAANLKVAFSEHLELEVDWPTVFVAVDDETNFTRFMSGNPFFALYSVHRIGPGYLRVGVGLAPPLADIDPGIDLIEDSLALSNALAIRGQWDAWLYAPDTLGVVAPAQWETLLGSLLVGADVAAGVLIPTDDRLDHRTDLLLQAALALGLRGGALSLGSKLQAVWFATSDGDNAQLALVPFVQLDLARDRGFLYSRFVLNLDGPLGVLGDDAGMWGLFVGGGARY